jgi:glycerol-3-phosphate dehydrogenase
MGPPWTSGAPLPDDNARLGGGDEFAPGIGRDEVDFLVREGWARTADDILWRRSKAGLAATPEQQQALARYLSAGQMSKRHMPVE